jgi:predicted DCC family thiol-disulfide oxidoreductase YuxK
MEPDSLDRPLLVFDGECPFCRAWVDYWKHLTGDRVLYAPFQEAGSRFPGLPQADFASAVKLIMPDGEVRSGAHAVFSVLEPVPGKRWMLWCYLHIPGAEALCETAYSVIARYRSLFYWATRLLWGIPLEPETYQLSSWLFLRTLAVIYFIAFASFGVQAAGLIGSHGILPAADFLREVREYLGTPQYWSVPTIFWLNASDTVIRTVWITGAALSLGLLLGLNWRAIRVALFFFYLSLVSAGQVFMSYQWDALLLEAGFLAIFLGSSSAIVRLFRWLLCRLMLMSGAVKLVSGDLAWRNFTALPVHYQTQPLPTLLAWYFYQLPTWFHRLSVGVMFFVELVVPFLILAPRRIRLFAAIAITGLQILILLTGNYAFFNLLTISLCLFLLDDRALRQLVPKRILARISWVADDKSKAIFENSLCRAFAAFVLFVSGFQMAGMFSGVHWAPADLAIRAAAPFEIINTYGLFAVMTTSRPEIVIEGSNDGVNWLAYEFKYKPSDLARRPVWVQPHQPRLDWQMWFAALGNYQSEPWTLHFMERLLEGSSDVLQLLDKNPFPGAPPRYVRALLYEYRFTTPAERRTSSDWWHRELKGTYVPAVSLRNP